MAQINLGTVIGPKGDKGDAAGFATPSISVEKLPNGSMPTAEISASGPDTAKKFDFVFGIPAGDQGVQGEKGEPGDPGEKGEKGDPGPSNTLKIGTVSKGANPEVTISGNSPDQIISFVLPQGDKGDKGEAGKDATIEVGSVTTGDPGTEVIITNSGTENAAVFDFTIPKGKDGEDMLFYSSSVLTSQPGTGAELYLTFDPLTSRPFNKAPKLNDYVVICWRDNNNHETGLAFGQIIRIVTSSGYKDAVLNITVSLRTTGETGVSGATPEIGENGNWFINGEDTMKPSRGETGAGFEIKKYYENVEDMNADYSNPEIAIGDCVAIKYTLALYIKGSAQFEYVGALKGDTGAAGVAGKDGTTFTPSVDEEGNLSWSNTDGKENPPTVNVKGGEGERGLSIYANSTQYNGVPQINVTMDISASSISSSYPVKIGDLVVGTFYDKYNTKSAGIYVSRVTLVVSDMYSIRILDVIDLRGLTGADGAEGAAGKDGTTFTPSVDQEGNLSWSNTDGKENPATVNVKGPKGDPGDTGLTAEQLSALQFLAQNMQVADGKVKFSVEIEAPSFNAIV